MGFLANKSDNSLMKIKTWSQLNTLGLTLLDCPAMLRDIHYIAIFYRFDDQDNLCLLINQNFQRMSKYFSATYKPMHCEQCLLVKYLCVCQKVSRWKQIGDR